MHAHERLRALLAATGCTACGGRLDPARVRVLAERDDLAFAELACERCGSTTLAMITGHGSGEPLVDLAEPSAIPRARGDIGRRPFDEDDVRAMRELLAAHRGDIRSLLALGPEGGPTPGRGTRT
jgi:hypothetical protein